MKNMYRRALVLIAGALAWVVLAAGPATAQSPKVEKQSSTSSSSAGSKSTARASTPRATPRSRPTRDRSGTTSSGTTSSGKVDRGSSRSRAGSSSTSERTAPRRRAPSTHRETRGGKNFEKFRDTKREQHIGDHDRRTTRTQHREREVRQHDRQDHGTSDRNQWHRNRRNYRNHGYSWYGYRGYRSPRFYPYYGAFGFCFPGFFESSYPYYRQRNRPVSIYTDGYRGDVGALDLDVSPEKAQIFIDGNYVGVADDFDGFPTFLWLEEGTYDVAIYRSGYETIFRQYTIYAGITIDVEDRMRKGESIHPKERLPTPTVNRDERIRRNREREASVDQMEERTSDPMPSMSSDEIGRLLLEVEPSDAVVYLDGNFLGTADEVEGLRAGLVMDPGKHLLEVVRPGYETREIEITLSAGERVDLLVELDRE